VSLHDPVVGRSLTTEICLSVSALRVAPNSTMERKTLRRAQRNGIQANACPVHYAKRRLCIE
jgi:hypothetical protein